MGFMLLEKKPQRALAPFCPCEDGARRWPQKVDPVQTQSLLAVCLGLLRFQTESNKHVLFHTVYGVLLQLPELAKAEGI
jgi:hypothetical protein